MRLLDYLKRRGWFGHHKSCGGCWIEVGTSGFAVMRIHEECDTCGATREWLMEH